MTAYTSESPVRPFSEIASFMNSSRLRHELTLVAMAMLLGIVMRFAHADHMAVEHFDEGIYTSSVWFDSELSDGYPGRQFFAPAGLPAAIKFFSWIAPADLAPFLPALILGSLMIPIAWLTARIWFGQMAGLIAAFLVAGSDYHIVFSRMAMTDVPALAWMTLAVLAGSYAVHKQSSRWMILAGVLTGLAWYTKYTGWLAVAILGAGTGLWWLLIGCRAVSVWVMLRLLGVLLATVFVMWLPLNSWLEPVGGYSAVMENHRGYWSGMTGWQNRLIDHLIYHMHFDSMLSCGCLGLGMIGAATRRWIELKRCTWNADRQDSTENNTQASDFPSSVVLVRMILGGVILAFLATAVSSFLLMLCAAIGGMAGLVLWPVLSDLHARRITGDLSAEDGAVVRTFEADLDSAPLIDPKYAACLVIAWFAGLLVTIPGYQPYPRLSLPLLAAIWLGASAGLAWWMEALLNVARRVPSKTGAVSFRRRTFERLTSVAIVVAIALVFSGAGELSPVNIWQNRTSLRDASWEIASIIRKDLDGEWQDAQVPADLKNGGKVLPEAEPEYDESGALVPGPSEMSEWLRQVAPPADRTSPVFETTLPEAVVYGFGEPSVLNHLVSAGVLVNPVQTTEFGPVTLQGEPLPTYFVMGPYALRTPGREPGTDFMHDWVRDQDRFEHVADVRFVISDIVAYNLYSPLWVANHSEAAIQKLELYRLK